MAYLIQRKSAWYAVLWDKAAKKKVWEKLPATIKTRRAARAASDTLQDDLDRQCLHLQKESTTTSDPTFLEIAAPILAEVKQDNGHEWFLCCRAYARRFGQFVGNLAIRDISAHHCRTYLSNRKSQNGKKIAGKVHHAGPSSLRKETMFLSRIFSRALGEGLIHENPWREIRRPAEPPRSPKFITMQQFHSLLDVAPEERRLRYTFLVYTGLRLSQACAVMPEDLDFLNRCIRIRNAKKGKTPRFTYRTIPMPAPLLALLKGREFDGPVLRRDTAWHRWLKIDAKAAKIHHLTFTSLRHTYASWLAQSGKVTLMEIRDLLGHESIKTTEIYAHLIPGQHQNALSVLDHLEEKQEGLRCNRGDSEEAAGSNLEAC